MFVEYNQIKLLFLSIFTVDETNKKIYYIRVGNY